MPTVLTAPRTAVPPGPRPLRILVDGLDLTGKTTLVDALLAHLAEQGVPARRHRGMLAARHPLEQALDRLPVPWHRSSLVTAAHLFGGFALDAVLARRPQHRDDAGADVVIQESYVDRTVAAGLAMGPYLPAVLALWAARCFPRFDLAVYLHAEPVVRRARLQARDQADVDDGDRHTVEDEDFARRFDAVLLHHLGQRHGAVLVLDSGRHTPQTMAGLVLARAGLAGETRAVGG
ncbi:hypothetical protein ABT095_14435 [Kitasatospora sp. NPDC002227]|uniref:hypothetical protein n=1 Tax=Kitasatospora sp. NPDC002227 TaxID=3154773 RepID=UPI00332E30E3